MKVKNLNSKETPNVSGGANIKLDKNYPITKEEHFVKCHLCGKLAYCFQKDSQGNLICKKCGLPGNVCGAFEDETSSAKI